MSLKHQLRPNNGDIVVSISGGCLAGVFTDIPGAKVVIVDWDVLGDEESVDRKEGLSKSKPFSLSELPSDTREMYRSAREQI
jgi:hypothetical protein